MKFIAKPVEVEAVQFDGTLASIKQFMFDIKGTNSIKYSSLDGSVVITSGGEEHEANDGDWIVQGPAGEIFACDPTVFEATYAPA